MVRASGAARNPVVRASVIYTAASVFNAAIPFLLLPILTRFLSPEEYGIVSTFMVACSIFLLVVGLEQHGFVSTNYFSLVPDRLKKHVANIFIFSTALVTAVSLLALAFQDILTDAFQLELKWIMMAIIVAYFQFISQLNLTLWQLESKAIRFGLFQVLHSLVNYVISIVLVVSFSYNEEGRIIGIAIASLVFGFYSFRILSKGGFISTHFDVSFLRASLLFSLPLVPHALAGWVNTGLDKVLINNMVSLSENGLYSISYQVAMIVGMIASSFNRAFSPFIFKRLTESNENLSVKLKLVKYTYGYYAFLLVVTVCLYVASPFVIGILVEDEFVGAQSYLFWIMVGFLGDGLYYGVVNYLFYARKTYFISMITVTSCTLHFAVSYLAIPRYGTIGAAYATAASFFFSFLCTFYIATKVYPMPWLYFIKER